MLLSIHMEVDVCVHREVQLNVKLSTCRNRASTKLYQFKGSNTAHVCVCVSRWYLVDFHSQDDQGFTKTRALKGPGQTFLSSACCRYCISESCR